MMVIELALFVATLGVLIQREWLSSRYDSSPTYTAVCVYC